MTARTRIVQIGNSRGVRVPKALLDHAALPDEVELQAERGRLIVRAARGPRAGWAAAARTMRERNDDGLLDAPVANRFDQREWKWR
jgi:antitoxin MazE